MNTDLSKIPFMNDEQIVEGIIMTIVFPTLVYFFQNKIRTHSHMISLPLLGTWIARKYGVNIYIYFRNKYHMKAQIYYL